MDWVKQTLTMTALWCLVVSGPSAAEDMNNARIAELLDRLELDIEGADGVWRFIVQDVEVTIITDENADRMRIISPVVEVESLDDAQYLRILQANFDSALDARYAIAKTYLWSAFIHPLSPLTDRQFIEGIGQVVNLVTTFGTTYHSGSAVFGGGDSQGIEERELIEKLIERGLAI